MGFYGGGRKRDQLMANTYEGAHVVAATPGRLLDFLGEKTVTLARVTYLVLDEADRMLDMGFADDVQKIASEVRRDRQALFFSATWSSEVQTLALNFCSQDPVRIRVGGSTTELCAREGITQEVVVVDFPNSWRKTEPEKRLLLDAHVRKVMRESAEAKVLVFVETKSYADELVEKLNAEGFSADSIHGGRLQEDRLRVLEEFRTGKFRLLVATDVLGRGIDLPDVSHVVVFEMGTIADYIHRIGRTARGKTATGHALVFFEYFWKLPNNAEDLSNLLLRSKQPVPPGLTKIANEVANGERDTFDSNTGWAQKRAWR